jgi:hypothetical protein
LGAGISGDFGLVNIAKKGDTDLAMPSRASKNRLRDPNLLARSVVEDLIGEHMDGAPMEKPMDRPKNQAAVALSMLGASKGGRARAESLSAHRRKMIAKKAAEARWRVGR